MESNYTFLVLSRQSLWRWYSSLLERLKKEARMKDDGHNAVTLPCLYNSCVIWYLFNIDDEFASHRAQGRCSIVPSATNREDTNSWYSPVAPSDPVKVQAPGYFAANQMHVVSASDPIHTPAPTIFLWVWCTWSCVAPGPPTTSLGRVSGWFNSHTGADSRIQAVVLLSPT